MKAKKYQYIESAISTASAALEFTWKNCGFPVDPAQLATHFGIKVVETALPEEITGSLIKKINEDPLIILNSSDITARKRFTCAYELGCYVFHVQRNETEYSHVGHRAQVTSSTTTIREAFANGFADALLMPETTVKDKTKEKNKEICLMAAFFGVPADVLTYRLKKLGLI